MRNFLGLAATAFLTLASVYLSPAQACPAGQSKGAFGWCYPSVGGVVGQTAEAAKKGDWNTVAKGVGDIVITYNCPACAVFAQAVMNPNDRAIISTIVGRGVILYAVGAPPELVFADVASGIATAIPLIGQTPRNVPAPKPPASRGQKIYKAATLATCIVAGADKAVTIGWVTAPTFIEKGSGASSTFPEIDLIKGDIVSASAGDCPEYAGTGQPTLNEVALVYENSQTVPGPKDRMKYFVWGDRTDLAVVAADK